MRYMMLIHTPESASDISPEVSARYRAFSDEVNKLGLMRAGDPLQPPSTARTIRVRNGGPDVTDGPFAETKEQLGGYFILECKDMDEALAYAAKIPGAATGAVEVRPVSVSGSTIEEEAASCYPASSPRPGTAPGVAGAPQRGQNLAVRGTGLSHFVQRISSPGDGNSSPHDSQYRDLLSFRNPHVRQKMGATGGDGGRAGGPHPSLPY